MNEKPNWLDSMTGTQETTTTIGIGGIRQGIPSQSFTEAVGDVGVSASTYNIAQQSIGTNDRLVALDYALQIENGDNKIKKSSTMKEFIERCKEVEDYLLGKDIPEDE